MYSPVGNPAGANEFFNFIALLNDPEAFKARVDQLERLRAEINDKIGATVSLEEAEAHKKKAYEDREEARKLLENAHGEASALRSKTIASLRERELRLDAQVKEYETKFARFQEEYSQKVAEAATKMAQADTKLAEATRTFDENAKKAAELDNLIADYTAKRDKIAKLISED